MAAQTMQITKGERPLMRPPQEGHTRNHPMSNLGTETRLHSQSPRRAGSGFFP